MKILGLTLIACAIACFATMTNSHGGGQVGALDGIANFANLLLGGVLLVIGVICLAVAVASKRKRRFDLPPG